MCPYTCAAASESLHHFNTACRKSEEAWNCAVGAGVGKNVGDGVGL